MATTAIYASAGDGYCRRYNASGTTWNDLVTGAGDFNNYGAAIAYAGLADHTDNVKWQYIWRAFIPFVTTIDADQTISSITLHLYGVSKSTDYFTASWNITKGEQASATALANSDYQTVSNTAFASAIAHTDWDTAGYNVYTFNATAIADFTKGTNQNNFYSLRSVADINNSAYSIVPGGTREEQNIGFASSEATGTSTDPYITVTHTSAASGPAHLKTWNGVAKANIKTINGIAIANVKTISGVD
jgi:hypothetical protein